MPAHELVLRVIDATTGQGIPDAEVQVRAMSWETLLKESTSQRTDSNGVASVRFATNTQHLVVGALIPGRAPRCVRFDPHRGDIIPDRYTLRLSPTEQAVGGTLMSPEGHPVPNAELRIFFMSGGDHTQREPDREYIGTASFSGTVIGRSGPDGRWTTTLIPKDHPGFQITAHHPNHAPTTVIQASPGLAPSPVGTQRLDPNQRLWAGQLTTTLNRSLHLAGRVTDSHGHPIAHAELIHAPHSSNERRIRSDEEGRFRWENLKEGPFSCSVLAPGHGPCQLEWVVASDSPPVDVVLAPSAVLRLRIVDPSGAGVEGAIAWPEEWEGAFYAGLDKSGPDGRLEWRDAPANETVQLYVAKFGWGERRNVGVVADGSEHEVVLHPAPRITGRVLDAESGRPITEFKAIPSDRGTQWLWGETQICRNGDFQLTLMHAKSCGTPSHRFRIEAAGYLPYVHEPIQTASFPTDPLEILLHVADAAKAIHGTIVQPNGDPAAGLEIQLIENTDHIMLGRGSLRQRGGTASSAKTDANGRFRFSPEAAGAWLIATGEAGFVLAKPSASGEPATLQLQAWGRIEGRIDLPDRARPDQSVWLDPGPTFTSPLIIMITSKAEPDSEGRFVFDAVRPAEYALSLRIADTPPGHHRTPITVEPGRTTEVRIADPGPRIQGRLVWQPTQVAPEEDKVFAVSVARPDLPRCDLTQLAGGPSPEERKRRATELRRIQLLRSSIVAAYPDSEGRFVTPEGLAPGDYILGIHRIRSGAQGITMVDGRSTKRVVPHEAMLRQFRMHQLITTSHPDIAEIPITVPAPAVGTAPGTIYDLGDITINLTPQP